MLARFMEPTTDAVFEALVREGLDDARHAAIVPTTALADRLLHLRSAAKTRPSAERALVADAG